MCGRRSVFSLTFKQVSFHWTILNHIKSKPLNLTDTTPDAEYIMRNAGLEVQAGIKIARRNINNLRYADNTIFMAKSEEELKKPLDESEEGEWKSWIKSQYSEN